MYLSKIHSTVTQIAGETEFQEGDLDILIERSLEPDFHDYFLDRYYRHIYMVNCDFGGAPEMCQRWYADAVNNKNITNLAWASHYLQDVSCVYHTTFSGQIHHLNYEVTANENADDYLSILGQENITPVKVESAQQAVIELATATESHEKEISEAIEVEDGAKVFDLTYERIHEATRYNMGLYQKYKNDLDTDTTVDKPVGVSLNMGVGLVFTCFQPFIHKMYPRIPSLFSILS